MYAASRWLRMGYRIPLISTLTTRESMALQVQRLDLLEHVVDARADLLALAAQGGELGAGALRVGHLEPGRVELGAQPGVLLGGAGLLGARAPEFVGDARLLGAGPIEDRDQLLQLLLEPVDRFDVDRGSRQRCLCHSLSPYCAVRVG